MPWACGNPPGAGKAVWVGFWGSSICVGVTQSAGIRAATTNWLFWNWEKKSVESGRVGAVGGVVTVGLEMTGKVGPGAGVKTSRLIVPCVALPQYIEFRY